MKSKSLILLFVVALVVASAISAHAQVTLPDLAEITVRAGANVGLVINDGGYWPANGATVGFERVKYNQDGSPGVAAGCAKSYFKWDFTGQNRNTNADLNLTWTTVVNNGPATMRIWSLDQAYP